MQCSKNSIWNKVFLLTVPRLCFFCWSVLLVMLHVGVCCAVVSVPCSLVVTCWERADLLAVMFVVFVIFPNVSWSTSEIMARLALWNRFKPSSKIFYWPFQGGTSFVDLLWVFFCLVFLMPLCTSVYLCLVVTCWERADLLALVCGV